MVASRQTLEDEYGARFSGSRRLHERARETLVDGLTHDSRRALPFPIYVERAAGSRKWDVDGNELVDWVSGHGALLLGHAHPVVAEATRKQLERSTHYGASHETEVRWAEMICELVPSAEAVRFTSSGTEASLLALRIARAATGKDRIVKFGGHFHGWHDYTIRGRGISTDRVPGVPAAVDETVTILQPETEEVALFLRDHEDVAAIVVEPSGASWGATPLRPGFLADLRRITGQRGVLLIFDEVVTGFRWAPGGIQELTGVIPDLTCLAKILAGGLPGGAVAGRSDLMATLEFGRALDQPSRKIPHYGTFNANPLSAAAGVACLELVADGEPQARAERTASDLRRRLNDCLRDTELPGFVYGQSSVFHIVLGSGTAADSEAADSGRYDPAALLSASSTPIATAFSQAMLLSGAHLFSMGGLASAIHTEEDVEITVEAFSRALQKTEGLISSGVS
ncbi:MAG: aminotransferase class III-fold pyridoxal phosphate-dependent enzyme [Dehalococcoidia bacterium]|nr:aminotransferase class III-fold pyridoxal phosphate-dependent enzyme [Dehalococcoidia bacterium]